MAPTFVIDLGETGDLEYKLPNEIDPATGQPKAHRKAVTGQDREGKAKMLSVLGVMPKFIHEPINGADYPRSLVVFEWSMSPEIEKLRFRSVTIEITFSAVGRRGDAESEAAQGRKHGIRDNHWDPEVESMVPSGDCSYTATNTKITGKDSFELGMSVSFNQFVSVGPKWTMERDVSKHRMDAVRVIGSTAVSGQARNRPNGVRWTLLENEALKSGVPAYMRTAVLLKRQPKDNGLFIATVNIKTNVSTLQDAKEFIHKLNGSVKKDHPVIFDPTVNESMGSLAGYNLAEEFKIVTLTAPKEIAADGGQADAEANGGS